VQNLVREFIDNAALSADQRYYPRGELKGDTDVTQQQQPTPLRSSQL